MGRTKGTLICPNCRRTNPRSHSRAMDGCRHCYYRFPQDKEYYEENKIKY